MSEFIDLGAEEEEIPQDAVEEQEAPLSLEEGDEEEEQLDTGADLPEELLSDEQRENRATVSQREALKAERNKTAERDNFVEGLKEFFTGLQRQAPAAQQPAEPVRPVQPQQFELTDEQAEKLSTDILSRPGGLARAIEQAVKLGERRAYERIASDPTTSALQDNAVRAITDRFAARKSRDPNTKFAPQIEPYFEEALNGLDLRGFMRMDKTQQAATLENVWDMAGGKFLREKATIKRSPSPGVARGGGNAGGASNRKVKIKMTPSQIEQLRRSAPNLFKGPEGEARLRKQIAEYENGVTSDPAVARMVHESKQFADATGFGA